MKLISLDPNTKRTGVVLWNGDGAPVRAWTVHANSRVTMINALDAEFARLAPAVVALEAVYLGDNPQSALKLAALNGGIEAVACRLGIDVLEPLLTSQIDEACNLSYRPGQRKQATRALARLELGDAIDEHQADAYCVGVTALGVLKVRAWAHTEA